MTKKEINKTVNKFRALGLLDGLRPYSDDEKIAAMNMDNIAKWFMENGQYGFTDDMVLAVMSFGRTIVSKNNYKTPVKAEDIIILLRQSTIKNLMDYVEENVPKKTYIRVYERIYNMLTHFKYEDKNLCEAWNILTSEEFSGLDKYFKIYVCENLDLTSEFSAMYSSFIASRLKEMRKNK